LHNNNNNNNNNNLSRISIWRYITAKEEEQWNNLQMDIVELVVGFSP